MARVLSVVAATQRDLAAIRKVDADLAKSSLAAAALSLAVELDEPGNSATSKAMCASALAKTLEQLRSMLPERVELDGLDDLITRRAERRAEQRAARSAAHGTARSAS